MIIGAVNKQREKRGSGKCVLLCVCFCVCVLLCVCATVCVFGVNRCEEVIP